VVREEVYGDSSEMLEYGEEVVVEQVVVEEVTYGQNYQMGSQ
jgi:hypothetical protein